MAYLSSLVSSVSNVISSTASVASAYASGTGSNSDTSTFLTRYNILDKVSLPSTSPLASIYVVYDGVKKDDQSLVTIFIHADSSHSNPYSPESGTPAFEITSNCARNALRRLRTLRHPDVLAYRDGIANPSSTGPVYIVTERVKPLGCPPNLGLNTLESSKKQNDLLISWGLFRIGSAIQFLKSRSFTHGLIQADCIFVNNSLEWKLGGFELLHSNGLVNGTDSEEMSEVYFLKCLSFFTASQHYRPPSMKDSSFDSYLDFWQFGCLVYEALSGKKFDVNCALPPPSEFPKTLHPVYKRLLSCDSKAKIKDFNKVLSNNFFSNPLIQVNQFLDELAVKDTDSRTAFFSSLVEQASDFPTPVIRFKLLPQLCTAVEFGSGGAEALSSIMKLGGSLEAGEFSLVAVPPLLRAFKSSDRQMRLLLLGHLPQLTPHLSVEQINDDLFPNIINGCSDLAPQLKEATVRGLVSLVDRLSQRNINQELYKQLQSLQFDAHPAVRTNALIGIGRVASHLESNLRSNKLAPLLVQSLRDPFPPARQACLRALSAVATHIDPTLICTKILPSLCPLILDPESSVRSAAHPTIDALLRVAKAAAAEIPEKKNKPANVLNGSPSPSQAEKEESGWTGWAVSSISKSITSAVQNRTTSNESTSSAHSNPPSLSIAISREASSEDISSNAPKIVHQTSNLSLNTLKKVSNVLPEREIATTDLQEDDWDAWGEDFSTTNVIEDEPSPAKSQASPISSFKKPSNSGSSMSQSSPQNSSETPAQKRDAYRKQLETRRQQRQSNQSPKPASSNQKSRGMALKPKQQS